MIRARLGLVQAGQGGNAGAYTFSDGLSADPRLAYYLQDLTPAQLQTALDGGTPSAADMGLNDYTVLTSCQQSYDPAICGPGSATTTDPLSMNSLGAGLSSLGLGSVPTVAWVAGAGILAALLFFRGGGR